MSSAKKIREYLFAYNFAHYNRQKLTCSKFACFPKAPKLEYIYDRLTNPRVHAIVNEIQDEVLGRIDNYTNLLEDFQCPNFFAIEHGGIQDSRGRCDAYLSKFTLKKFEVTYSPYESDLQPAPKWDELFSFQVKPLDALVKVHSNNYDLFSEHEGAWDLAELANASSLLMATRAFTQMEERRILHRLGLPKPSFFALQEHDSGHYPFFYIHF